jgi:hypothetical protein
MLPVPVAVALEFVPTAMALLNVPVAVDVVLLPIPTAKLVAVLVQVEPPELPALMPLMDAQVALAAPAPLSDAIANAPEAAAPSSRPPASRFFELAVCRPIPLPLSTVSRPTRRRLEGNVRRNLG